MCSALTDWHKMFIELLKWKRGWRPVVCVFLPSISRRSNNKCFLLVLCIVIGTLRKWIFVASLALWSHTTSTYTCIRVIVDSWSNRNDTRCRSIRKEALTMRLPKNLIPKSEMVAFTSASARCDCCGRSPVTYWNKVGRLKALGSPTDRLSKIPLRATCNFRGQSPIWRLLKTDPPFRVSIIAAWKMVYRIPSHYEPQELCAHVFVAFCRRIFVCLLFQKL